MERRLNQYLDDLFDQTPPTKRAVELREEMYRNMSDKYKDLIASGKDEETALNMVVASLGDPKELLDSLSVEIKPTNAEQKKRSAILTSIAVTLYILAPIPLLAFSTTAPIVGLVLLLFLAAIATGLLVFDYMSKPTYHAKDETMVEEFRAWSSSTKRMKQTKEAVSSALWTLTVAIYLLISFNTRAWSTSWVIFLVAAAIQSLITLMFNLKSKGR